VRIWGESNLNKRIAVVTGGIGGLGTAICRMLARNGRTVVAADLPGRPQAEAAFHAACDGLDVHSIGCNVTDFEACGQLFAEVETRFGAADILVNAAGITRDQTLRKMSREQWDAVLSVDLDSVFNTCRHAIDGMVRRGFGRIVNIGSVNGQTGQFGQTNYSAAKAGLHGFTMALAREVAARGVTVNTVSPGYIDTDMTRAIRDDIRQQIVASIPVGRMGEPDDIARVVDFVSRDDAGYLTGANIPVNGGMFMSF
jgi:acetoacetyl-CoA reductase